jgi:hypothetical protein
MSLPYGGFTTMLNPTQIWTFAPRPRNVRFKSQIWFTDPGKVRCLAEIAPFGA